MDIAIYEDSLWDLINRYSCIDTSKHKVEVFLCRVSLDEFTKGKIVEMGIDESRIHTRHHEIDIPTADIYFLDGLHGECFEIIDALPETERSKVCVISGSPSINKTARERKIKAPYYHLSITSIIDYFSKELTK